MIGSQRQNFITLATLLLLGWLVVHSAAFAAESTATSLAGIFAARGSTKDKPYG